MRILAFLFIFSSASLFGQVSDLPAQDPGAAQDAEAAREKLLKASDELDMIQSNAETMKAEVDGMKADISRLEDENTALKAQLAQLQTSFDQAETSRAKERQVLLDEVAALMTKNSEASSSGRHHPEAPSEDSTEVHLHEGESAVGESGGSAADGAASTATDSSLEPPPDTPPPPHPQKGYYHVVESGETLTMICSAYREQGVKVTVSQVKKANGLTDKSVLKVGQKLFIPKP